MNPSNFDVAHFKKVLLTFRDELLQSEHSGKEGVQPVKLNQMTVGRVSRMDALRVQAMAKASQHRRHTYLQRMETALGQIEKGISDGVCDAGKLLPRNAWNSIPPFL